MLGISLNLILISLAALSLAAGILFFLEEKEAGYIRGYTLLFGTAVFLICSGYALMGFLPNVKYAPIPRIIGLYGIDVFLLMELSFLTMELKRRQGVRGVIIGFFALFVLFDLIIFGRPKAINYIRYEYHTAYENADKNAHIFHYAYIFTIAVTLMIHGVLWFKSKKTKRDRQLVVELILSNYVVLFAAIPDVFKGTFASKYPTFSYCIAFAFVYFSYWFAIKHHMMYTPTVKNVSREIFYSIDVPVLIFDLEGYSSLYNPSAAQILQIKEGAAAHLRSLFTLSDVESLRLLAHAKKGFSGELRSKTKAAQKNCSIHYSIRLDNTGEPFCIIVTVLLDKDEAEIKGEE